MDVKNIEYDIEYDVAIIGAGMIGSAAAKYASEDVETSILIGPDQPQDGIHSGIQKLLLLSLCTGCAICL